MITRSDVIIIGAGAAGLMCAMTAGRRGRRVTILDHGDRPGRKILLSGGGRCNFTNRLIGAEHYLSGNPHFSKSALARYTQWDFIDLVERYGIAYEERSHGQLFCRDSARQILDMLVSGCRQAGVKMVMNTPIGSIAHTGANGFSIKTPRGDYAGASLVVATGGLSLPGAGASPLGYEIARRFGIGVRPPHAGLVPFTLNSDEKKRLGPLSGIAVMAEAGNRRIRFRENILFTHRGISGPAMLQLSSYWTPGESITIDLLPETDLFRLLETQRLTHPKRHARSVLAALLPKRLIAARIPPELAERPLHQLSHQNIREMATLLQAWSLTPGGTEGYRTAEVTVGGVDVDAVSSQTMQARETPGLFFVGEVLDVTGQLGGYNLQWAWSSGWCAGQVV